MLENETKTSADVTLEFVMALDKHIEKKGLNSAIGSIEHLQQAESDAFGIRLLKETLIILNAMKKSRKKHLMYLDSIHLINTMVYDTAQG